MRNINRILIFGRGKKYFDLKDYIDSNSIIGFLDNMVNEEHIFFQGLPVYNPMRIPEEIYFDAILIMSTYYYQMKHQLIDIGVDRRKIYSLFQIGELQPSKISEQERNTIAKWKGSPKKFLLIQHDGGGGGATTALADLALVLAKKYNVLVTFPNKGETISFYENNRIPYICNIQMNCNTEIFGDIVADADVIFVNAIINNTVIEFLHYKNRPFYLWLHDHAVTYERSDCGLLGECINQNVRILSVSQKAIDIFCSYIKKIPYEIFPLGTQCHTDYIPNKKLISTIPMIVAIGDISTVKGQDILINALDKVRNRFRLELIGGRGNETEYVEQILHACRENNLYTYMGKIENKKIHNKYLSGEIDILICPSRFETMSIATIEAMSYGIPVIVSDMTGIAEYIQKIEPNCVFESENSTDLAKKIEWILSDKKRMDIIGNKMKKIYDKNFSLEQLEKRCNIFR